MQFTIKLSTEASKLLGKNTRLRLKQQTRAGKSYVAVRPSFRCKKSNHMVRVVDAEISGVSHKVAHFRESILTAAGCPELALGKFYLRDVGYGWFLIEEIPAGSDEALLDLIELVDFFGPEEEPEEEAPVVATKKTEDDFVPEDDGTPAIDIRTFRFPAMAPTTTSDDVVDEVEETTAASE